MGKVEFYNVVRDSYADKNYLLLEVVGEAMLSFITAKMIDEKCECIPSKYYDDGGSAIIKSYFCADRGEVSAKEFSEAALSTSIGQVVEKYGNKQLIDQNYLPNIFIDKIKSNTQGFVYSYQYAYDNMEGEIYNKGKRCLEAYHKAIDDFANGYSPSSIYNNYNLEDSSCQDIKNALLPLAKMQNSIITEKDLDDAVLTCIMHQKNISEDENFSKQHVGSSAVNAGFSFIISRFTGENADKYYNSRVIDLISNNLNIETLATAIYSAIVIYSAGTTFFMKAIFGTVKAKDLPMWVLKKMIVGAIIYSFVSVSKCFIKQMFKRLSADSTYNQKIIGKNLLIILMGVDISKLSVEYIEIFDEKIYTENPQPRIDAAFKEINGYLQSDIESNWKSYLECFDVLGIFYE